jgi:Ser/Thr protein kinase RdoA (MazF antagonist)
VTLNSKALLRYKDLISREYLEDEKVSVYTLPGHGINSKNYKISFDDADKNLDPIHLKILHKWDVNLADKLVICDHCFEADVKTAEIIKTKGGNYFVKEPDFIAVCFRFYEAQEYTASQKERTAAARELGKLNNALSKYKEEFRRNKLYDFLTEDEFDTIKQACIDMDEFKRTVSNNIEWVREFTKRLSPKFKADKYSYRLEHCDYHPRNLVFKNGDVAAILDFDSILSGPKNLSVAFACDRFSERASGPGKISQMIEFIQAYKDTNNDLSTEEILKIPTLIKWEALQRINYILRSHFFEHDSSWNNEIGHQLAIIKRTNKLEEDFLGLVETERL